MSDNLNIVVDTERAQKALDALGNSSDRLIQKLAQLNTTTNLDKILASITNIDAASAKTSGQGFKDLQDAINKLDTSKLAAAAAQISSLSNVNVANTAASVGALGAAINNINPTNLNATTQSLGGVSQAARNSSQGFDSFATAVRNAVGQMGGMTANAATLAGAFMSAGGSVNTLIGHLQNLLGVSKAVAGGMIALAGVVVFKQLAQQAGELAQSIAAPTMQIDRFKSAIDAVAGQGAGAKAFDELGKITKTVGGNIGQMLDPFQKFVIAAKTANVDMKTSVDVFRGFQTGLTATGASAVQTERVFNALQQMMAKGTVQAEELKGQLGDSMPGALDIAAKSLGVTTKELLKLVENGKVLSADLLPKMARELENTFGSAARARMQGFTGQLDALRNNVFALGAAFGQGGLGGAVAGLTSIMRQLNEALSIPGLDGFVRLLGDLTGALLAVGGSVITGVIQGLSAMAAAIGSVYNYVTQSVTAIRDWLNSFGSAGQTVTMLIGGLGSLIPTLVATGAAVTTVALALKALMGLGLGSMLSTAASAVAGFVTSLTTMSGAAGVATTATGALTGALSTFYASITGGVARVAAFLASLSTWAGVKAAATVATTALTGALGRLWAVMMANPLIAVIGGVTALIVALKQFGVLDGVADKFTKMSVAAEAAKTSATLFSEAADRLANRTKLGADTVYDAATKFTTYAEMADRAKKASLDLEEQQKAMARATAESGRELKEQEAREKSYQESVKGSTEALRYKIDREKEAAKSGKELEAIARAQSNELQASANAAKGVGDMASKNAQALKQNTVQYDISAATIANYTQKIKDNESAIKASESSIESAKAKHEAFSIANQRSSESIEKAQESIKKYGVVLDETQQRLVTIVERTGKHREEAAQLAVQISNLVRTQADWQQKLAEEIALNDKKIAANQELVAILKSEKDAIDAKVASGQKLTDLDKLMLDRLNAAIAARNKDISATLDEKMAQESLALAKEKGINLTEAAIEVANRYKDATKGTADAAKIAADAVNMASGANDKAKASTESVADAAKKAADESKRQADAQKDVADKMSTSSGALQVASDAWNKLSTTLGAVTTALQPAETQLQSVAAAINSMGQNVGTINAAGPQLVQTFASLNEPVTALGTSLPVLSTAFGGMSTSMPVVAAALTQVRDAIVTLVEPLPAIVEPINSLRMSFEAMSPVMAPIGEAFITMSTTFPVLAESGMKVAESFGSIGRTVDKIKELPAAVDAMSTAMTAMNSSAEQLIARALDLDNKIKAVLDTFMKSKEVSDAFATNMGGIRTAIDETISKLDELIKKAEEAANALAKTKGGGGGGSDQMTAGSQRLGGMAGASPQSTSVSASMFASAPQLAKGIANTNDLVKRGGGGFPTILHPNEAVVPLPRGRSIPVEMKIAGGETLQSAVNAAQRTLQALGEIDVNQQVMQPNRAGYASPLEASTGRGAVGGAPTPLSDSAAVSDARAGRGRMGPAGRVDQTVNPNGGGAVNVNMTVNVKDADSFKRSQPQIQADMFRAISRQAAKDR